MHWIVCSVYYLGCMVVTITAIFASLNVMWLLSHIVARVEILSCMEPTLFQVLEWQIYISSRSDLLCFGSVCWLCIECSCSPNVVIFKNFLVFLLSFFYFWTIISFSLDKYSLFIFDVALHYQLDTFKNGLAHILISLLLLVAETIKSKILANFQICISVPLKWFYSQLFWKLRIWFDLIMEKNFCALQKWPWLLEINFKL